MVKNRFLTFLRVHKDTDKTGRAQEVESDYRLTGQNYFQVLLDPWVNF